MEENDEEEEEALKLSLRIEQADTENDELAIDLRWSDVRGEDEKDISKVILLRTYKSKLIRI